MNQHFIPRFVLEGFVDRSRGNRGVWVWAAASRRWKKRPTKKLASENNLYSLLDDDREARDDSIEELLEFIETSTARVIKKAISRRRPMSETERALFTSFCTLMMCRNPTVLERSAHRIVQEGEAVIREVSETREDFQRAREEYLLATGNELPDLVDPNAAFKNLIVQATKAGTLHLSFALYDLIFDALAAMAIDFVFTTAQSPFVTSDIPYSLDATDTEGLFGQFRLPLSSEITAIFLESAVPSVCYVDISPLQVAKVNVAAISVARKYVISSRTDAVPESLLEAWGNAPEAERNEAVGHWWLRYSSQ